MATTPGRVRWLPAVILAVGLLVFAALSVASRVLFDQTEDRLLQQHTNEAVAVLESSVSQTRAPLDAAAKLADVTNGDSVAFAKLMAPYVGDTLTYSSAALFEVGNPVPVATAGTPFADQDTAGMLTTVKTAPFVVVDLLAGDRRRLGYAVADTATTATTTTRYVVYAERILSANPNIRRRTEQPFEQINYAIYLGTDQTAGHLLGASTDSLPITGRRASGVAAFGNTQLLLVTAPIGDLGGGLFASLWWIVALVGLISSTAFSLLTNRLLHRRDVAVGLADDNARLYDEQRQIAETLQLSLLPEHLDVPAGDEVVARYWPALSANLIGGDFYDCFEIGGGRWAIAIGDVCGKGIEAAALTGLARHTIRAIARTTDSPADVLRAVHTAMRDHRPATFCTACLLFIEVAGDGSHVGRVSLGGHPHPLLRHRDGTVELVGGSGTLLGMVDPRLVDTEFTLDAGDTIVLYTDGLTDAPGDQAVTTEELTALVGEAGAGRVDELAGAIHALIVQRHPDGADDDTALLVVRIAGQGAEDVTSRQPMARVAERTASSAPRR